MLATEFKPINAVQRAKDQVATLRQKRSATEYCNEFRLAVLDIPHMDEAWKLDSFLRGLKPNVQRELERYPPAGCTAGASTSAATRATSTSGRATPPGQRASVDGTRQHRQQQWRSDTDRHKLRKEGRCFFCREAGAYQDQVPQATARQRAGKLLTLLGRKYKTPSPIRRLDWFHDWAATPDDSWTLLISPFGAPCQLAETEQGGTCSVAAIS